MSDPAGRYSVAGLVTVELRSRPAAERFFLAGLAAAGDGNADLRWDDQPGAGAPVAGAPRAGGASRSFAEVDGAGRWHLAGPGHDGRLPTQDLLLRSGASLVHGAAVAVGGRGVLIAGPSGAGKTAISLAALTEARWQLIADDVAVATAAGRLLATPAPIALYPHHLDLLPAAARRELSLAVAGKRRWTAVRALPVVGRAGQAAKAWAARRGGRLELWARHFEAQYRSVRPERLYPIDRRCAEAPLNVVVLLERSPAPGADVAARLVAETYADGDLAGQLARYAGAGLVDEARHRRLAAEVLGAATGAAATVRLPAPAGEPAAELQRRALDAISAALR